MKGNHRTEKLLQAVQRATCSFTAAMYAGDRLREAGFQELEMDQIWEIKPQGKYVIHGYDSCVIAFHVGEHPQGMLKIAAAHTDHPCLSVKPSPEMTCGGYGKINTEIYGGAILNTWLDRPLSIAGRVSLKGEDVFHPEKRFFDVKRPVCTIPNLAIHLNRQVNKGIELNKQTDMLPLCRMMEDTFNKDKFFLHLLAQELGVEIEDILDFEAYVYNCEEGCVLGMEEEFISAPRLDNITSVEACLEGICTGQSEEGIQMIALFDNEEIGSRTKQGADSQLLSLILEKLYLSLGYDREQYINAVLGGFLLSLDVAHATHPNRPEKGDPTNPVLLNHGIVIKRTASQSYATDAQSIGIMEQICRKEDIPYQKYACRSDGTTGSTLGTIANKYLPMRSMDMGVAVLAMHSARELMGVKDQEYLEKFVRTFFLEGGRRTDDGRK